MVKMKNKFFILGLFSLLLVGFVSAGVIQPHWDTHPVNMDFGETKIVNFKLTNSEAQEVTYEVEIIKGGDIASLEQIRYTVPAQTENTIAPLTITIPGDYDRQVQRIELLFKIVGGEEPGMVGLTTGYLASFDVILTEKPVEKSSLVGIIIALIAIIVILAVIILILAKRRRR